MNAWLSIILSLTAICGSLYLRLTRPPVPVAPTCWTRVHLDGTRVYSSEGCKTRIPLRRERVRLDYSPLTTDQRLAYERNDK